MSSGRTNQSSESVWTLHRVPWAVRLALSGLHGHATTGAALVLHRVVLRKEEVGTKVLISFVCGTGFLAVMLCSSLLWWCSSDVSLSVVVCPAPVLCCSTSQPCWNVACLLWSPCWSQSRWECWASAPVECRCCRTGTPCYTTPVQTTSTHYTARRRPSIHCKQQLVIFRMEGRSKTNAVIIVKCYFWCLEHKNSNNNVKTIW